MSGATPVFCPFCTTPLHLPIPQHFPGHRWTPKTDAFLMRADACGLSDKMLARIMGNGISRGAISSRLVLLRKRRRSAP